MSGRGAIERRFKRSQERVRRGLIRPPGRGGRHGATPQLEHHLFQGLAALPDVAQIDGLERQPRRPQLVAMASDTVRFQKSALGDGR